MTATLPDTAADVRLGRGPYRAPRETALLTIPPPPNSPAPFLEWSRSSNFLSAAHLSACILRLHVQGTCIIPRNP